MLSVANISSTWSQSLSSSLKNVTLVKTGLKYPVNGVRRRKCQSMNLTTSLISWNKIKQNIKLNEIISNKICVCSYCLTVTCNVDDVLDAGFWCSWVLVSCRSVNFEKESILWRLSFPSRLHNLFLHGFPGI